MFSEEVRHCIPFYGLPSQEIVGGKLNRNLLSTSVRHFVAENIGLDGCGLMSGK